MPKVSSGRVNVTIQLPEAVYAAVRADVGDRGLSALVGEVLAKKYRVRWEKPKRGRPVKPAP